jgi:hyperosmotically inducible periplasmic protein
LATPLQQLGAMTVLWARIVSLALAALLALAVGGVVTAHARTVGEFIDDARIAAEVTAKLTAESPSNFRKINVKSETGIVTLSGTLDSAEKRTRAAQIASGVNGVKGLVNDIQVSGAVAPTPPTSSPPSAPPSTVGTSAIDATGTVASVDASTGTITLTDGRVLHASDRTSVYQPTTVNTLRPGDQVLLRGATPITVRAPETRMGTVARVDNSRQQLVLTNGSVVRVPTFANVHRGTERLALSQIEPGAEVVIQLAPMPAASSTTTAPTPTQTPLAPTGSTSRTAPDGRTAFDAMDVSIVWTPSASASR